MVGRFQQDPSREAGSQGHPPARTHPAIAPRSPTPAPRAPAGVSVLLLMAGRAQVFLTQRKPLLRPRSRREKVISIRCLKSLASCFISKEIHEQVALSSINCQLLCNLMATVVPSSRRPGVPVAGTQDGACPAFPRRRAFHRFCVLADGPCRWLLLHALGAPSEGNRAVTGSQDLHCHHVTGRHTKALRGTGLEQSSTETQDGAG